MVSQKWKSPDYAGPSATARPDFDNANFLTCITVVTDVADRDRLLQSLTTIHKPTVLSFINAHGFNLARKNTVFAAHLRRSDLLLRDGVGMAMLMRLLRRDAGINMNGTDFIPMIISAFAGRRVVLCGTTEPYLEKAREVVVNLGAKVILTMHGFVEPEVYVEKILPTQAELIILGMGMPKQEQVAMLLARRLTGPVLIVNGGAILDFWGNRFPRAPALWQALRLEWLFRLLKEPKRLWRRYLLGNITFLLYGLRLRIAMFRHTYKAARDG